mgnify:CR=1 FL=1
MHNKCYVLQLDVNLAETTIDVMLEAPPRGSEYGEWASVRVLIAKRPYSESANSVNQLALTNRNDLFFRGDLVVIEHRNI